MTDFMLSIIIPVKNSAKSLEACIESIAKIKKGSYPIEIILIDGQSTDDTLEIIKRHSHHIEYWVSEPDAGIYDAMNKGIKYAKGKWMLFLGADDLLSEDFECFLEQVTDPYTVYYGNVWMPNRKIVYDGKFSSLKLVKRNICHQSILYPKEIFDHLHYNLRYPVMADYAFNIINFNKFNWEYLPFTVSIFNDYDGTSQKKSDLNFEKDKLLLIYKNFTKPVFFLAWAWLKIINILRFLGVYNLVWKFYLKMRKIKYKFFTLF